ncbi:MAG: histone deacetylase [bacterium]|nr:histone deacetylase [bacterium]
MPLIYTDDYNIRLFGIQKFHPFDTEKYKKVYNCLVEHFGIEEDQFIEPSPVTDSDLLKVHTQEYLDSLHEPDTVAKIAELTPLRIFPDFILQSKILNPMRYATGGTILGAELALEKGWAINLSGGYHHAKADSGEGFCFFADIPLAVCELWEKNPELRVLVIDLDAHQGNGIEAIFKDDERVFILDVYNRDVFPQDAAAKEYIDFPVSIGSHLDHKRYLKIIKENVPEAISRSKPDLIIYNAGSDILAGDSLGLLNITASGIIKRDEIVFRNALDRNIPVLMVLSGGYTKQSGLIVGKSIENLLKNILNIKIKNQEKSSLYFDNKSSEDVLDARNSM